jgi:hypothetical protein
MKRDPLQAYLKLKAAAQKGDPRAKAELAKIERALTQAQQRSVALARVTAASEEAADLVVGATQDADEVVRGDDLERADHVAQFLPPGSDSLDHKALLRNQKWSDLASVAPFSRTNPPSALAGTLGNITTVDYGQLVTVAKWDGEVAETQPLTITIGPVFFPIIPKSRVPAGTSPYRPFGQLTWGTRSVLATVNFDLGKGIQFTVGASSAVLSIGADPLVPGDTPDTLPQLSGWLSFWPCVRTAPVTRTVIVNVPTTGTGLLPIPSFAKRLVGVYRVDPTVSIDIAFLDSAHNTVFDIIMPSSGSANEPGLTEEIFLPNDIEFFAVHAPVMMTNTDTRFVFELGF